MRLRLSLFSVAVAAVMLLLVGARAQQPSPSTTRIAIDSAHPGAAISPTLFGVFFEDINFAADGGLYPELVKNRSFEFTDPVTAWRKLDILSTAGELDIRTDHPLHPTNPHYLRIRSTAPGYGVLNSGFRGMGIESGAEYRFSAWVRSATANTVRATVVNENGEPLGSGSLTGFTPQWKHFETTFRATATSPHARLNVVLADAGAVDLDMVSLFPVDTWNRRPNGLRKDLVQLLHDMHPGFMRFPGGCIVEGRTLATRYRWKTTVGDIAERQTIVNRWNDEFDHRPTPDYFQSFGLGFYEYFQLAEDIGASPLPILNCGMACQFNSSETAALDQLAEYRQDALDLIDFANGPVTSPWGKLRAAMGHPAPFNLKMIGIGNEQWGPSYLERYQTFATALKAAHPEIQLIVSAGPVPSGEQFDFLWSHWRKTHADIVDEHYYSSPQWFLDNSARYDHYDRSGPKVFAGEYAAQTSGVAKPDNHNNWNAAISEAAFMTGLERNADVVRMASYAPLFAHVDAWQWTPDAIWFDNLRSYATPNFYVQTVFASNVGTRIVPATPAKENGLYTSASLDERTGDLIVKAVNVSAQPRPTEIALNSDTVTGKTAQVITLGSANLQTENTLDHPKTLAPETSTVPITGTTLAVTLRPYSLTVYRIPMR